MMELIVLFACAFAIVFAGSLGLKTGKQSNFYDELETAQGQVVAFDAGLIVVEFDKDVINSCGDTSVYGFITGPNGFTLQLKPVFIPDAKSQSVNQNTLVFPVWDILAFLNEPGAYTIEFFVDNNCSFLHRGTITLPPVAMLMGAPRGQDG